MAKVKLYNPELETTELYEEKWLPEKIDIKDEKDVLVVNHYWQDPRGELWGNFKDPMENVQRGFDAYRVRKGYLFPIEIRQLRQALGLPVRKFADALGISSSALTQIENNHRIQTKYQDVLFRMVRHDPQAFLASLDDVQSRLELSGNYEINDHFYAKSSTEKLQEFQLNEKRGEFA
ncbi:helix-turn-helix domain-containing protein [Limosilactobacillus kribbianus]|uniref:helix-turn-helix domain-containing protein n=1 Tax=Limosilactobacillus kribbianus TaxID=2982695 RepID=UPI002263C811|nr:helix-turn-helix domain-containing protein [Limosilactobacillus kribbianus]